MGELYRLTEHESHTSLREDLHDAGLDDSRENHPSNLKPDMWRHLLYVHGVTMTVSEYRDHSVESMTLLDPCNGDAA